MYWLVVDASAAAPTPAQVKAQTGYGSVTVRVQGSQATIANTAGTLNASGLTSGTAYKLYVVAYNNNAFGTEVQEVSFSTAEPVVNGACGSASGTASAPAPSGASLCSAGTASTVSGSSGAWQWGCNGSDGGTSTTGNACSAPYASQSITGLSATPATIVVGGSSTLSVTGSGASGQPVTYSSSAGCTINATTATATGTAAGTCTITADQAGTGDSGINRYLAAAQVSTSITVNNAPINGACGSSHGSTFTSAPAANLCSAGTASGVTGSGPWSWTCGGQHGGNPASCSASIQTYSISASASPAAGGSASCSPSTVNHGGNASCTATANAGYQFSAWSGDCNGASCALTNVTAAKTVTAAFAPLPVLTSASLTSTSLTGASLQATSDVAATGWWLVVARGSAAPSPADVKNQGASYGNSPSVNVLAKGSVVNMLAGQAKAFSITGLQPGTAYDLYLVAEDATPLLSATAKVELATLAIDTTPDAFSFSPQTGLALATLVQSNAITVSGINSAAAISVSGGEYQIGSGTWSSSAGTVNAGDSVRLRHTSSSSYSSSVSTTLTIGGVSGSFTSTTQAAPPPPPPPPPPVPDPEPTPTPPPPPPGINTGGASAPLQPGQSLAVRDNGQGGSRITLAALIPGSDPATLDLPGLGPVQISGSAGSQLQVVPAPGGGYALRLDGGSVRFSAPASGGPLLALAQAQGGSTAGPVWQAGACSAGTGTHHNAAHWSSRPAATCA
ncbi:hypothetical protein MASR1M59_29190 [Melaminivora sp.]